LKNKIGFRLDWLEMIMVLVISFFAGIIISGNMEDNYIYSGLLILSVGIILIKKRIKIPMK
jgi:hypothetical protein